MKRLYSLAIFAVAAISLSACATGPSVGTSTGGLEMPIEKAAIKFAADVREGGYQVTATEELGKWVAEKKSMVIIDTMPADAFAGGHLPGAVSGPMPKTEKELTAAEKEGILKAAGAQKDTPVVVYCGFVACRRSHIGAKTLIENGYKNVYRYPAGITGWKEAGYQVEK
ncbi:rhodanese-like domain-containing protein [bacterium]|nr:MAG: rhodanese-like domain-containing protein [bacterium]